MPVLTPELTPEQETQARVLADAIAHASADDLLARARWLVAKPSHAVFGPTERQLRDRVHRIGAKALDLYLAGKKQVGLGQAQQWIEGEQAPNY